MTYSELLDHLKEIGITKNQYSAIARIPAFRKRFKIRGQGHSHEYGYEEIKAIVNVVVTKMEWIEARKFLK